MEPDDSQQARGEDAAQTRVTANADSLLKVLQLDQRSFASETTWKDLVNVGAALLLLPAWIIIGMVLSPPWTWYLTVPVLIWTIVFVLAYPTRRKQMPAEIGEPLLHCVKESLTQVEDRIWLRRNEIWWNLMPLSVSILTFAVHSTWVRSDGWSDAFANGGIVVLLLAIFGFTHFMTKKYGCLKYEQRRQELLSLLSSLGDETTREHSDGSLAACVPRLADERPTTLFHYPVRLAIGSLLFLVGFALFLAAVIFSGADSFLSADSPREPLFDDVSAFVEEDVSRVNGWLREQVDLYPSLSVAIVRDGEIVYQNAFGFEDVKASKTATPQTPYHVASVTKVFTASLAVLLHDRGVVDLDQPVVKYLPGNVSISTTPELGATITLRQLASHTSGLPRGVPGRVQSVEGWYQLEPQRLYDHLANVRLDFEPGTDEEYSNLAFGLLGHALECAAGKPFDRLLKEMVCDPLQLTRTAIQVDDTLYPATGYDGSRWRFERKHSFRERLAASGGLVTSVQDLAKFLTAQMTPGVFSEDMLKQLHTEAVLSDGSPAGTALGWSVRSRDRVGRILKKNGGRSNCRAWIGFAPEHQVGVAVVTNCGGPAVDPIGYWLLERSVPYKLVTKNGYAKVAPYTGVRWENDRPIVRVKDKWSPLVSIDGIPIDRIMEFSEREFGKLARKRFAEDLVEVLSTMGHEPKWEVTLGLKAQDGQVKQSQIRMTEHNRDLVRE